MEGIVWWKNKDGKIINVYGERVRYDGVVIGLGEGLWMDVGENKLERLESWVEVKLWWFLKIG